MDPDSCVVSIAVIVGDDRDLAISAAPACLNDRAMGQYRRVTISKEPMSSDVSDSPSSGTVAQRVGAIGAAVITLGLACSAIHFYLVPEEFDKGATGYGTAFILTGVAYLAGVVGAYAPVAAFARLRTPALICLALLAIASITAYLSLGYFDTLGWWTKAIEAALVVAVAAQLVADRSAS